MSPSSSVTVSGIEAQAGESQTIAKLPIRSGVLVGFEDVDGNSIPCLVGPTEDAAEVYVVKRCDAKTGRYRDDVVMLGFDSPALARAVFFAQAQSPREYRQLDTWDAAAFLEWLSGVLDEDDGDEDEAAIA